MAHVPNGGGSWNKPRERNIQSVEITAPLATFGEILITQSRPIVQYDALYGLRTKTDVETFIDTTASGSATVATSTYGREFKVTTGTTSGGYGVIRSKSAVHYRAGQGNVYRFTGRFGTPVANSRMAVGAFNVGSELSFGYNGTTFGILYRTAGRVELRKLTITNPASGAETATITLNGVAFTVSLTAGTTSHNAYEIQQASITGWTHQANTATVLFNAQTVGSKAGTYSFSSTGTATGTFTQVAAGAAVIDTWIPQSSWNENKLLEDNTGGTGLLNAFVLDPSKGNVFQIQQQYLGYGAIIFYVEHPSTGRFIKVHTLELANSLSGPSLDQPSLKLGLFAASLGSTTNIECYSASLAGFNQGEMVPFRNPQSYLNSKSSIGTTFTSIISFRLRNQFNGYINLLEAVLKNVTVSAEGTKPAEFMLLVNPTFSGTVPVWTYLDESHSIMEYDTTATTVTVGSNTSRILTSSVPKSGPISLNLVDYDMILEPEDIITLACRATSATTDFTASMTWLED